MRNRAKSEGIISRAQRYTMSIAAHDSLNNLLVKQRQQRRPSMLAELNGFGTIDKYEEHDSTLQRVEGLSHSLNVLADTYQIREHGELVWTIDEYKVELQHIEETQLTDIDRLFQTLTHTCTSCATCRGCQVCDNCEDDYGLYEEHDNIILPRYNRVEQREWELDTREWEELSKIEQHERLEYQKQQRHAYELQLSQYSRLYYMRLARVLHVEPVAPKITESSLIAAVLEAIGLQYIKPPEGYQQMLGIIGGSRERNPKKYREEIKSHTSRQHKLHGNFTGKPWIYRPIRPLPAHPTQYTQEDVNEAVNRWGLRDLAQEAIVHNPNLVMPNRLEN